MAGIIAGAASSRRRLLAGAADPAERADMLLWAEGRRDVTLEPAYALTAGSVGLGMDSDYELGVTSSATLRLVVGETVNVSLPSAPSFPGDNPASLNWSVKSGSGTSWTLSVPNTFDLDDWIGEALGSGTLTPVVRRTAEAGTPTAGGWVLAQGVLARQPRLVTGGGYQAFEARAPSGSTTGGTGADMEGASLGNVDWDDGFTIGILFALRANPDVADRLSCILAGAVLRLSWFPASWGLASGTAANIGAPTADDTYRLIQCHVRRTAASTLTYRARVGTGALETGTITTNTDASGATAVTAYALFAEEGNAARPINDGWCALNYVTRGDTVDDPGILDYIASQYPAAVIPSI